MWFAHLPRKRLFCIILSIWTVSKVYRVPRTQSIRIMVLVDGNLLFRFRFIIHKLLIPLLLRSRPTNTIIEQQQAGSFAPKSLTSMLKSSVAYCKYPHTTSSFLRIYLLAISGTQGIYRQCLIRWCARGFMKPFCLRIPRLQDKALFTRNVCVCVNVYVNFNNELIDAGNGSRTHSLCVCLHHH